jgi:23S rRNA pseudouridine2605 synthase
MTHKTAEGERIAKVLARAGVASRRAAETMIAEGRVAVNGQRIDSPALNVTPADRITVDGRPVPAPAPPRLWLYHKPAGLVTSARDEKGRPTVFDRLPEGLPRVMPVGRLDLNSEGLLLLTNDGEVKRRLELPSTGWLRRYRVRVNGKPDESRLEELRAGLVLDGERFQPMQVAVDRQQGANAWLTVGLREGRNREVRRAMEAVGLVVNRLIRIGYGPFQLAKLAPGEVEEVRPRVLRDQLGLTSPDLPAATRAAGGPKDRSTAPAGTASGRKPPKRPVTARGSAAKLASAGDAGKTGRAQSAKGVAGMPKNAPAKLRRKPAAPKPAGPAGATTQHGSAKAGAGRTHRAAAPKPKGSRGTGPKPRPRRG